MHARRSFLCRRLICRRYLFRRYLFRRASLCLVVVACALLAIGGALAEPSADEALHWAFQPVRSADPPTDTSGWATNPIDQFVLARLRAKGIEPVELADRRTLIIRAYFDLIGLPPTPADIDAFLADETGDAFAKLVDRLLASRHYGERWGRYWLDVVRYADTAGDNSDCPIPEMYRYRDYVIDAFNADKPYDEFLTEQLAGDILAETSPQFNFAERKTATGYIALTRRFGTRPYQYRHLEIEDLIDCTGRALLGVTMRCARCHDHKFDPMTNEDYYALYGIFASTTYSFSGSEASKSRMNLVSLLLPHEQFTGLRDSNDKQVTHWNELIGKLENEDPLAVQVKQLNEKIEPLNQQIAEKEKATEVDEPGVAALKQQVAPLIAERDKAQAALQEKLKEPRDRLQRLRDGFAPVRHTVAFAAKEGEVEDVKLQQMGDPKNLGDAIPRGVPKFLNQGESLPIAEQSSGRLEFARWLTTPGTVSGGLTARVMTNRIWQHHFGRGIVATPSNFGVNGQRPTHPELLDWLANQFVQRGWSIKSLHRLIMLSTTYRLSSDFHEQNAAVDPSAQLLWRYNRRRLDAEAIRDAMLAVSGNLNLQRPGPHPFPPHSKWKYSQHAPFKAVYPTNHRSVYLMTQRIQRHPYLAIFDGPDPNLSTGSRARSIVPQQALYLMNNPFVIEQAKGLATRLIDFSDNEVQRIEHAFQLAWRRPSDPDEQQRAADYLAKYRQQLAADGAPAETLEHELWTCFAQVMLTANEFLYVE